MSRLFDHQMINLAGYDCFSQVVFKDVEGYRRMKEDNWYQEHLVSGTYPRSYIFPFYICRNMAYPIVGILIPENRTDHEKFADTKRSAMTIGWITEFVRDGQVVDGLNDC